MPVVPAPPATITPATDPVAPEFTFFLGAKSPWWLNRVDVPLFLAYPAAVKSQWLPSCTTWALDSGGFTELQLYGRWTVSPGKYASQVRWWYDNIAGMQWAACQDWVCHPFITEKTGLSVGTHQRHTVESYLRLRELQPTVPWAPVLQGWCIGEYVDHIRQYEEYGVDLTSLPIVGIGSIAARQHKEADYIEALIREVAGTGIRLHGFGLKHTGLKRYAHLLASADSIAWAQHAVLARLRLPECTHGGKDCSGCITWALRWREMVLATASKGEPPGDRTHPSHLAGGQLRLPRLRRPKPTHTPRVPSREALLAKGYHACKWPGCEELIAPTVFNCKRHWAMVPKPMRKEVIRVYAPNLWVNGEPPEAYTRLMAEVMEWVARNYPGGSTL